MERVSKNYYYTSKGFKIMTDNNETRKMSLSQIAHMKTVTDEEIEEAYSDVTGVAAGETPAEGEALETATTDGEAAVKAPKQPVRLEHTDNVFTIEAKPTKNDMYRFMCYHTFMNATGVVALLIGVVAIAMVVVSIMDKNVFQIILFSIAALMFALNSPVSYYFKAKKNSRELCKPENIMTYVFSDAGFDISFSGDNYFPFKWSDIIKLREGKTGFYVYTGRNRAFMIPKADVTGGSIDELRSLFGKNVGGKLSLKYDKE